MDILLLGCMGTSTLAFIVYAGKKSRTLYAKMHHYQLTDDVIPSSNKSLSTYITSRIMLYSVSLATVYGLARYLDIDGWYVIIGFVVCISTFLTSMHLSTMLVKKHFNALDKTDVPLCYALALSMTIPCTAVVLMLSLFVTSPFILSSALAMILLCLDQMLAFFAT